MKKSTKTNKVGTKETTRQVSRETTTEKGTAFEKKVARWTKREFDAIGFETNQLFKGKTAVRPFEVDVVFWVKDGRVIWVECKDRKASIKRADIFKLLNSAIDVRKNVPSFTLAGLSEEQAKMNWSYLLFVSTSPFDSDAINFAKAHNIGCYQYDGKKFQEKNKLR